MDKEPISKFYEVFDSSPTAPDPRNAFEQALLHAIHRKLTELAEKIDQVGQTIQSYDDRINELESKSRLTSNQEIALEQFENASNWFTNEELPRAQEDQEDFVAFIFALLADDLDRINSIAAGRRQSLVDRAPPADSTAPVPEQASETPVQRRKGRPGRMREGISRRMVAELVNGTIGPEELNGFSTKELEARYGVHYGTATAARERALAEYASTGKDYLADAEKRGNTVVEFLHGKNESGSAS